MRNLTLLIIIVALAPSILSAQIEKTPSVLSSSGGFNKNENFSISWTLGEIAITTLQGESMALTQGFQQAFVKGTGIIKSETNWNISVYPNPVQNELNIQFDLHESKDFLLEIQDVTGRVIMQEIYANVYPGDLRTLNTSGFVSGVYFLRVLTIDYKQVKVISLRKL